MERRTCLRLSALLVSSVGLKVRRLSALLLPINLSLSGGIQKQTNRLLKCECCFASVVESVLCCPSGGVPAVEPLQKGLSDLHQVCQHVLNTFQVPPRRHFLVSVCPLQLKQKKGKKRNLKAGGSVPGASGPPPHKPDQNNEGLEMDEPGKGQSRN